MSQPGTPNKSFRARTNSTQDGVAESSFKRKGLILAIFLILAASLLNALLGERGFLGLAKSRSGEFELQMEVLALREENQRLSKKIEGLRVASAAIERRAREVLGMIRPGELVLTVRGPD